MSFGKLAAALAAALCITWSDMAICAWIFEGSPVFEPTLVRGPNLDKRLTDGVCPDACARAVRAAAVSPDVCASFGV